MACDAKGLPHDVRSALCEYTKKDKTPYSPIDLCDEGWRRVYKEMVKEETDKLNTPKVANIKNLFSKYVGLSQADIDRIANMSQLDAFISFRGEITHRVKAKKYVNIEDVYSHKTLVEGLVLDIDKMILSYFRTTYPDQKGHWRNTY